MRTGYSLYFDIGFVVYLMVNNIRSLQKSLSGSKTKIQPDNRNLIYNNDLSVYDTEGEVPIQFWDIPPLILQVDVS